MEIIFKGGGRGLNWVFNHSEFVSVHELAVKNISSPLLGTLLGFLILSRGFNSGAVIE